AGSRWGVRSAGAWACAAAIHGRHIYVLGGCDWSSRLRTVERMDLISGKWEPVEDMSTPRGGCAAVATGPYIYAIGGSDGMHRLHSVERLDVRFGWWEPVADMGTRRDGCAAAVVAGCFPVDTPAQSPLPLTAHSLEGGEAIAPAPDALPTASQWQAARAADMRITGAGGLVTLDLLHRAVQAMRRQLDSKPALPAKLRALVCLLRDYAEAAGEEEAKQEGEVEREQEVEPPEGVVLRARWADAWLCRDRWQAAQREVRRAVAEVQGMEEQGEIRAGTRGPPAVLQQTIDARDEARGAYLSTLRGGLEEREALGPSVSARLEELQELVATWRSALQGEGMAGAIVDMPDAKHPKRDPRVAAANYDEWEKNRRGHRLARTTESALAALRGALHACFASDEPEDKEGDPAATRTTPEASPAELGRCTEEAHNAMRAELSFLEAPRDGEDELPDVGELREAGAVVLTGCLREEAEAKRTAEEIRMLGRELQELQGAAGSAAQEGVEDAVKRLQGAGQAVARLRRQLKRRLLDQEELAEAAAAAEAGESARAAELAEAARGEVAEVRRQLRSEQCTAHTAMCALAAVERHFPEVMWHMQSGVPAELLPLWRPERSREDFALWDRQPQLGARHEVFQATDEEGRVFAVKEFPIRDSDPGALQTLWKEASLLHRMRHPAIAPVLAIFVSQQLGNTTYYGLQMPWYEHGRLDQWYAAQEPDEDAVRRGMLRVLEAVAHLHQAQVVHCDIKPANIVVDGAGRPHLLDFDISVDRAARTFSTGLQLSSPSVCGTQGYLAPEMGTTGATPATDVFAFGATLEVVTSSPARRSSDLINLLHCLQAEDPARRPSAAEACQHPYFAEVWAWQHEQARLCCVRGALSACGGAQHRLSAGVECTNRLSQGAHFVCDRCLTGHVRRESDKAGGRVGCPCAQDPETECESCDYSDVELARHLPAADFERHLSNLRRNLEEAVEREMEAQRAEDLRREVARLKVCKICCDNEADTVFMDCGHIVSCNECAVMIMANDNSRILKYYAEERFAGSLAL
ncbi:hypothetical protein CYMTET_35261, partial [Cymbomonas tetramitiformis]